MVKKKYKANPYLVIGGIIIFLMLVGIISINTNIFTSKPKQDFGQFRSNCIDSQGIFEEIPTADVYPKIHVGKCDCKTEGGIIYYDSKKIFYGCGFTF